MSVFVQVALDVPVGDYFDYVLPNNLPAPIAGVRVQVPFGSRKLIGIVLGTSTTTTIPADKLKPLLTVIDTTPILPASHLELGRFLSRYYHYPLGETLMTMLPTLVKKGNPLQGQFFLWQLTDTANTPLTPKQQQSYDAIKALSHNNHIHHTQLQKVDITTQQLNALVDKGYLIAKPLQDAPFIISQTTKTLTDEQQQATSLINASTGYQGFLLDGVTGSGKTEVYLQAIAQVLQKGNQALVLVPEIGLTPQTYERFAKRFCVPILVLHSQLNDKERLAGFAACQEGSAKLIIATRSALFYPFAKLGLIVVDEAHDPSYKQKDHLRYHTCDVALYLGRLLDIAVILGTATPSLEQLSLASTGKLTHLKLTRPIGAGQNTITLVDRRLGHHLRTDHEGKTVNSELSPIVIDHIDKHLARGEQVLVFLNQRGYAPVLLCHACGHQFDCPHCDKHLTLHTQGSGRLRCHHCHHEQPKPTYCIACNSTNLITLGQGTSQLCEHLHTLFGDPQACTTPYPILQIDRDTTRKKGDWQSIYKQVLSNKPMILVGTQMLAKGHHFPNVTLVVVVNADSGLMSADFRASEHVCQQIIQVAGRAGRAEQAGVVLIQTLMPNHPLLTTLSKNGYHATAQLLLKERKLLGLPPTSFAALIESEHATQAKALEALVPIAKALSAFDVSLSHPSAAPFAKRAGRYFSQLFINAKNRQSLHEALAMVWHTHKSQKNVKLTLTVDPIGF